MRNLTLAFAAAALAATAAFAADDDDDAIGYAVTSNGLILKFELDDPAQAKRLKPVKGIPGGERIVGIDFRPANKMLYAVTNKSKLYTIDLATSAATAIGTLTTPLTAGGTGVDFNPVPDRLRIVNDADQNLRANPADATNVVDKPLAYAPADANAGKNPMVAAAAYTDNVAGTKTTKLYVIDAALGILATQAPPNDGILNTVGPLDIRVNTLTGFDIRTDTAGANHAYAVTAVGRSAMSKLYKIDLATGKADEVGTIRGGLVTGFAIQP
jgi:hypothetical protein